jgi:hypothetical protein
VFLFSFGAVLVLNTDLLQMFTSAGSKEMKTEKKNNLHDKNLSEKLIRDLCFK